MVLLQVTCKSTMLHPWTYQSWQGAKTKCHPEDWYDVIVIQSQPSFDCGTYSLDILLSTPAGSPILTRGLALLFPSLFPSLPCTLIDLTATYILPVNVF